MDYYKNLDDYEKALDNLSKTLKKVGDEMNEWKLSLNAPGKGGVVKESDEPKPVPLSITPEELKQHLLEKLSKKESEETILAKSLRATGDCRELSAKMDCVLSVIENIMNYIKNSEDLPEEVADAAKEYCYDVVERSMVVHEQIYTTLNKQADMVNQIL